MLPLARRPRRVPGRRAISSRTKLGPLSPYAIHSCPDPHRVERFDPRRRGRLSRRVRRGPPAFGGVGRHRMATDARGPPVLWRGTHRVRRPDLSRGTHAQGGCLPPRTRARGPPGPPTESGATPRRRTLPRKAARTSLALSATSTRSLAAAAELPILTFLPILEDVLVHPSSLDIGPQAIQLTDPIVDDRDPELIRCLLEVLPDDVERSLRSRPVDDDWHGSPLRWRKALWLHRCLGGYTEPCRPVHWRGRTTRTSRSRATDRLGPRRRTQPVAARTRPCKIASPRGPGGGVVAEAANPKKGGIATVDSAVITPRHARLPTGAPRSSESLPQGLGIVAGSASSRSLALAPTPARDRPGMR